MDRLGPARPRSAVLIKWFDDSWCSDYNIVQAPGTATVHTGKNCISRPLALSLTCGYFRGNTVCSDCSALCSSLITDTGPAKIVLDSETGPAHSSDALADITLH